MCSNAILVFPYTFALDADVSALEADVCFFLKAHGCIRMQY
jgi:hypothetical protein